jgi:hypothetical protein
MKVRCHAEFSSTLPDDHIENEEGTEIIQFGGKSVAAAIGEILRGLGCEVEPPAYAGDHGWDFNLKAQGRRFWCQVTLIEGYVFVFENPSWMDKLFKRRPKIYLDLLRGLGCELAADPRFSDIRWLLRDEVMSGAPGASQPLD